MIQTPQPIPPVSDMMPGDGQAEVKAAAHPARAGIAVPEATAGTAQENTGDSGDRAA